MSDIQIADDISKAIEDGKYWRKIAFAALRRLNAPQIREVAEETGMIVSLCGGVNEMLRPQNSDEPKGKA